MSVWKRMTRMNGKAAGCGAKTTVGVGGRRSPYPFVPTLGFVSNHVLGWSLGNDSAEWRWSGINDPLFWALLRKEIVGSMGVSVVLVSFWWLCSNYTIPFRVLRHVCFSCRW